jgi:putative oxidoreductase
MVTMWAVQLVLAGQFAAGGLFKLAGDQQMVAMFADIGAGQWLRVLVGVLELAAAVGLLVPRLARLAAAGLVALMTGAALTNIVWLATSPALPLVFLLLATVVVVLRRSAR